MNHRAVRISTLVVFVGVLSGCAVRLDPPGPTLASDVVRIKDSIDILPPVPVPAPASGSLWTDAGPGAALARDTRAYRINDLLTVQLFERSSGTNGSETDLNRNSQTDIGAGVAFGLEQASPQTGKFSLNQVLQSGSSTSFSGDGTTTRSNLLTGTITTRVMRVLPNGDLMIAGQKTVMVNREQQILTMVGTVRAVDIASNNQIASSSVGDLTVRLWGRGEVDSTIRQGWFMRIMNRIWPF